MSAARKSEIDTSDRDLGPVGPLSGPVCDKNTRSERVERNLGHLNG